MPERVRFAQEDLEFARAQVGAHRGGVAGAEDFVQLAAGGVRAADELLREADLEEAAAGDCGSRVLNQRAVVLRLGHRLEPARSQLGKTELAARTRRDR